jgi:hypothetical protein
MRSAKSKAVTSPEQEDAMTNTQIFNTYTSAAGYETSLAKANDKEKESLAQIHTSWNRSIRQWESENPGKKINQEAKKGLLSKLLIEMPVAGRPRVFGLMTGTDKMDAIEIAAELEMPPLQVIATVETMQQDKEFIRIHGSELTLDNIRKAALKYAGK